MLLLERRWQILKSIIGYKIIMGTAVLFFGIYILINYYLASLPQSLPFSFSFCPLLPFSFLPIK